MAGPNTSRSPLLTPSQRIAELAEILAAGLTRLLGPKSSQDSADFGESSLHISPAESGDPTPESRRTHDG